MAGRIHFATGAITRIRALGEKKILEFLDEVSLGSARNLADILPPVQGFRPQSEAGIKQQKLVLTKRLTSPSGGTERDHYALFVMWRAWAWENLGDPDAVDHLLDDFEEASKSTSTPDERPNKEDRTPAIALFTALKQLSLDNKCSREKIARLFEFSPLSDGDDIQQLILSSKSAAEIEHDTVITNLPRRLQEDEQDIQRIKDRLAIVSGDAKAITSKVASLENKVDGHAQALRLATDTLDRLRHQLEQSDQSAKEILDTVARLERRIEELTLQHRSAERRQQGTEERVDNLTLTMDQGFQGLKGQVEPLQAKLTGISPVGAEAVKSISAELEGLAAKVLAISESPNIGTIESLIQRVGALESHLSVDPTPAPAVANVGSQVPPQRPMSLTASGLPGVTDKPKSLADVASVVGILASVFQSLGLKNSAAAVLADEIAAASLTCQMVLFKGAYASAAVRACAAALSTGHACLISIPIGLTDPTAMTATLRHQEGVSGSFVRSVVIDGINRSTIDVMRDGLLEYVTGQSATEHPPLFCFASLISGLASLPVEIEHLELGPVFDLDYLDWRVSGDFTASPVGGVVTVEAARSLRYQLLKDVPADLDEALRVLRRFARRHNPRIEKTVAAAYTALCSLRASRSDVTSLQSLAYGWLIPVWLASEVSKDDADSELDGGKFDGSHVDVRIAAMLKAEPFSSRQEDAR